MQKTIVSALAVLASTAVALASDLPSKTAPSAPAFAASFSQYYVGGNVGGDLDTARAYTIGAVAGWIVLPFFAVEGSYDLSRPDTKVRGDYNYQNTVAANALPQYKLPGMDVKVYGLAGLGYRWNSASTVADHSVYNVGGGVKYDFTKNIEIDGRYRRIDGLQSKDRNSTSAEDRATIGVNYKF